MCASATVLEMRQISLLFCWCMRRRRSGLGEAMVLLEFLNEAFGIGSRQLQSNQLPALGSKYEVIILLHPWLVRHVVIAMQCDVVHVVE